MFSKSFKDYFKNPVIVLPYIFFTLVIEILSNLFTNPTIINKFENFTENTDSMEVLDAMGPIFLYLFIVINIGIFLSPVILGWTYSMSKDAVDGVKPGFSKGFKNSWKYYFRLLSSSIIVGLIIMAILFLFFALCMPMIISLSVEESLAPIAGIVVLSLLLMLVILVISIVLLPLPVLLVYDDLDIDKGFRVSFKFGFKKFFHILGPLMLLIFIMVLTSIPVGVSQIINETTSPTLSLIMGLINTYLMLFMPVYIMNLYKEHKYAGVKYEPLYDNPVTFASDVKDGEELHYDKESTEPNGEETTDSNDEKSIDSSDDENPDDRKNNFIV